MNKTGEQVLHIAMLTYPQALGLDTIAPMEVFGIANQQLIDDGLRAHSAYRLSILSPEGGTVRLSSGLQIVADYAYQHAPTDLHTLFVSGAMGNCIKEIQADQALLRWLSQQSTQVQRLASVCSGALLLAKSGVLNQHSATTHWDDISELRKTYPDIEVIDDAIYVHQGHIWTSAGVTAGMDLALAMVAEDHGHALALKVAKRMVLFMHRSGGQKQFSQCLDDQLHSGRFNELVDWLREHIQQKINIAMMAEKANMSERNFTRRFQQEYGVTASRFLENLRIEAAKGLLEHGTQSLEQIARLCGFGKEDTMHRTFQRRLNVKPSEYRQRFSTLMNSGH